MINIGLIGFGYWGPNLARNFCANPDFDLAYICDFSADRLEKAGRLYPQVKLLNSTADLFNNNGVEAVAIATRSGQVMLYELTDLGRSVCTAAGIDPGPRPRTSAEHMFWVRRTSTYFEKDGYVVTHEHAIKGNGAVDLLAERPGERIAVEVETGKSDVKANLAKIRQADFDRVVLVATSPSAVTVCQRAVDDTKPGQRPRVELLTWLDVS